MVALDVVADSLAQARKRLRRFKHVFFVLGDMRVIPVQGPFDLVVAANDPFVHMSRKKDRQCALGALARSLRTGGRFILDTHWLRSLGARRKLNGQRDTRGTACLETPDREAPSA